MPHPSPSTAPGPRATSRRGVRLALLIAGVLVALVVAAGVALVQFDWNRAKPWISERVSESAGRHFEIAGNLSATWHWPDPLAAGWRRWIPGVTLQAERITLGNPPGFGAPQAPTGEPSAVSDKAPDNAGDKGMGPRTNPALPQNKPATASPAPEETSTPAAQSAPMATVASASASLHLLPLLSRHLALDTVVLSAPDVALERRPDGHNNWTFTPRTPRNDGRAPWQFTVDQFTVRQGRLAYADPLRKLQLDARIDTLPPGRADGRYGVRFEVEGRFAKARVEGTGKAGQLLSLRDRVVNYPLQFEARAGSVATSVEGTLANPRALRGMDLQVMLQASSMADLYELTGLVLPNTPPFRTRGHLRGSLEPGHAVWDYSDFAGTVGESDLRGDLRYVSGAPRPRLSGTLASRQLRLADLGPVVGATPAEVSAGKRSGKVLPDKAFATERWNAMDMDIQFAGERVLRPESLPLENLSVHAVMSDAVLRLAPLRFGVARGQIETSVVVDSHPAPLAVQADARVRGLRLSALFPKVELVDKSLGHLDGALALRGTGNSVAKWLGTSSGQARLYVRDGTLSRELLNLAALNVGSVVVAKLFGDDREVQLRCAVADMEVRNGVAYPRTARLSTSEAVVEATGTVDLAREQLDLHIKPQSLQWKFFSLRTPLYVRGSFAHPDVGVEAGPLLLRAGGAIAAAVAAPAALALLPITVPGADDDTQCAPLLKQATQPVKAGRPGTPERRSPDPRTPPAAAPMAPSAPATASTPAPEPAR